MGASTLLLDEDTCAANFMIRDNKMIQLVTPEKEPITPFISVVRSLYTDHQISTIMVVGGTGDYFSVADRVILMDCYKCEDATCRAMAIVEGSRTAGELTKSDFGSIHNRTPILSAMASKGKVKSLSRTLISYGDTELELGGLEQIVSIAQTNAIASALQKLSGDTSRDMSLKHVLNLLLCDVDSDGLHVLAPDSLDGQLALPRLFEISGAINRLRRPCIKQGH